MSYSYEDTSGDWNSNTFPYNLSTFTASSNVHPDLPSEPPGYDEFEFSFPSELSPSLFSLPFVDGHGRGLFSPTGSSFPALSSTSHSPAPTWPENPSFQSVHVAPPLPQIHANTSASQNHQRQDSAQVAKKLFEDSERSALDAFFNKTLDDATTESGVPVKAEPSGSSTAMKPEANSDTVSAGMPAPTDATPTTVAPARKAARRSPASKPQRKTSNTKRSAKNAKKATGSSSDQPDSPMIKDDVEGDAAGVEVVEDSDELTQLPAKRSKIEPSPRMLDVDLSVANASGPGKRSSHIASEQKRRSTIKDNYKSLVDLLLAGEPSSGISLLNAENDADGIDNVDSGAKKSKPKGKGRGRKGQDGAGATKSVVLEKAADYLRWLERGNEELEKEIARVESVLAK